MAPPHLQEHQDTKGVKQNLFMDPVSTSDVLQSTTKPLYPFRQMNYSNHCRSFCFLPLSTFSNVVFKTKENHPVQTSLQNINCSREQMLVSLTLICLEFRETGNLEIKSYSYINQGLKIACGLMAK